MIQLIWSLINLFLVLSFFFFVLGLVIRGRKFLDRYFLPFVYSVLFFGVFGLLNLQNSGSVAEIEYFSRAVDVTTIPVVHQFSNKLELRLFKDSNTGDVLQEYTTSSLHGFVSGLRWTHLRATESPDRIEVEGFWDWYLLGNRVISTYEVYEIVEKE